MMWLDALSNQMWLASDTTCVPPWPSYLQGRELLSLHVEFKQVHGVNLGRALDIGGGGKPWAILGWQDEVGLVAPEFPGSRWKWS